jgi:hypothetical protein
MQYDETAAEFRFAHLQEEKRVAIPPEQWDW